MPQNNSSHLNTNKRKVLVTGTTGLVGNEVVRQLLAAGEQVRALQHHTSVKFSHPNLEIFECDILDVTGLAEAMEGITYVFHCAAIVSFDPKDQRRLLKINVEGSANVINACINAGVKKIVYVSSVASLGRIREGQIINESMNWTEETSNSVYGKSKYLGELEVWRGIGEGLQAVIVNPTIILGGDNWETGSTAIFKSAYNEFAWYTEGVSGFVDVRDVAKVMILLMNNEITAQRFIISALNLTYKEIFSSIAKLFGKRPPSKRVTPAIAGVIWRIEAVKAMFTGKKPLVTKETARTAQVKAQFDNSKILQALPGFKFIKIEDTLAHVCAILKEKHHL